MSDLEEKRREQILRYLDKHGVVDKDSGLDAQRKNLKRFVEKNKRNYRITLDLHGKTQQQAESMIRGAVQRCRRQGINQLLIIHGRGHHSPGEGGVLKQLVRIMLSHELRPYIRSYAPARPKDGGAGATLVRVY
ncbi:MAG: Smr/MutS family protein [Chitinivibrionales bacterium]